MKTQQVQHWVVWGVQSWIGGTSAGVGGLLGEGRTCHNTPRG